MRRLEARARVRVRVGAWARARARARAKARARVRARVGVRVRARRAHSALHAGGERLPCRLAVDAAGVARRQRRPGASGCLVVSCAACATAPLSGRRDGEDRSGAGWGCLRVDGEVSI